MDVVAAQTEVAIPLILQPTRDAFIPLLEAHRSEIESIERKSFQYGTLDRQKLDVYYPHGDDKTISKAPILVFTYGGGFNTGDRVQEPPYSLVYGNVGAFFAKRGYLTVIPDYRLVPDASFPEPVEDIRDAILWILKHPLELNRGSDEEAGADIFIMAHSAGACYAATLALYPGMLPASMRGNLRGLILKGGAYRFPTSMPHSGTSVIHQLYGTPDNIQDNMPITLLERATDEDVQRLPDVLFLMSEKEPGPIRDTNREFVDLFEKKTGRNAPITIMQGHNHISPHWCLGTGEGEEWAVKVDEWMKGKINSHL